MAETMESPGGVYALCCRKSGTRLLCATVDMQKERQWFLVCQEEGHCPKCELEKEWTAYGPSAFAFEIVVVDRIHNTLIFSYSLKHSLRRVISAANL